MEKDIAKPMKKGAQPLKEKESPSPDMDNELEIRNVIRCINLLKERCEKRETLYDYEFPQKASLSEKDIALLARKSDGSPSDKSLFAYLLMMKRHLGKGEYQAIKKSMFMLIESNPYIEISHYGFPENWEEVL